VRWRVSVCISSAACSRILRPFVLLEITLSNGTIRTMEMSIDKFNELRFSVAQVCFCSETAGTVNDDARNSLGPMLHEPSDSSTRL
jgi:hypothetical protein